MTIQSPIIYDQNFKGWNSEINDFWSNLQQETEEALDEMKQTIETTKSRMNKEAEVLKAQIASLDGQISAEEEKAKELEHKSKMFSYGQYKGDDQEKMLEVLNEKVEEVYRSCIGDNEANISTLQASLS